MSLLKNLAAIRRDGDRAFVKSERERWTCRVCGMTIDIHHYCWSSCGKTPEWVYRHGTPAQESPENVGAV